MHGIFTSVLWRHRLARGDRHWFAFFRSGFYASGIARWFVRVLRWNPECLILNCARCGRIELVTGSIYFGANQENPLPAMRVSRIR